MLKSLKELIRYRALVAALVTRYVSMRYRGSALGFIWTFLNPLCLMLVYTVVFHFYMRATSVENYTLFLFCGLLPWIWVSSALHEGVSSLVASGHLITKSLFPAHILPLVSVLSTGVNFILSLVLLAAFLIFSNVGLHLTLLFLPFLILIQGIFLFGLSLALSTLNVKFRDVQHLVTNILTFLFFLCPIVYPVSAVPQKFRFTIDLNPISSFTVAYHSLVLDGKPISILQWVYLIAWSFVMVVIGYKVFDSNKEAIPEYL